MVDQDLIDSTIHMWEEQLRNNEHKMLPISYFKGNKEQAHEIACHLFRYVFENILDWSPTDAVNYLTFERIKQLNLSRAFNALIYPPEYKDRRCATFYVGILCYPQLKKYYNEQTLWIMEYNNCIDRGRNNYVRFDDENIENAVDKARFLLNHVLISDRDINFNNIEEVYEFFSSKKVKYWLATKKLGAALKFFESPLDFLHQSLPTDVDKANGRNDFVLQFTEFKNLEQTIQNNSVQPTVGSSK